MSASGTVIGHPFNPPHVIPLVEVVGGTRTAPEIVRAAMEFYASIGKKPIHLKKELPGHMANRPQSALTEGRHLIGQGVLDVADADDAVSWGPGLRWGVMGPNLLWHLAAARRYPALHGHPDAAYGRGAQQSRATRSFRVDRRASSKKPTVASIEELEAQRDEMLFGLIACAPKRRKRVERDVWRDGNGS